MAVGRWPAAVTSPGGVATAGGQSLAASRKPALTRFDLIPAPGLCPRGGAMSFADDEAMARRHVDGAGTVTRKARRRERYFQDPDYRARERAQCRAYYQAHKLEINARCRAYYHAHKQDIQPLLRRGQLKRLYGMSPADYDALLAKQGGVCAICGKLSEETLCVDHCHATGTIRGLLCRRCNTGFGCYQDDQAAMIVALAYLGRGDRDCAGAAAGTRTNDH